MNEKELLTTRKKRLGDRCDGYRIRHLSATSTAAIRFMRSRLEAQVFSNFDIDLTRTEAFIREHKNDLKGISLQTIIFAALVRTYAKFPRCGRFIIGKKLYGTDYTKINILVKPTFDEDDEEVLLPLLFNRTETLPQVIKKYNQELTKTLKEVQDKKRQLEEGYKNPISWINGNIDMIGARLSGLIMFLDRHNKLPASIMEISPFHGSAFFTNVGSIGLGEAIHHLYEVGTVSLFIGIGSKNKKLMLTKNGIEKKSLLHLSVTVDERICEGYYWASAMRTMKRLVEDPELLMTPPLVIRSDN